MRERRLFYIAFVLLLLPTWLSVSTDAQSIVTTLDFRPPGIQDQVGFDYKVAVVEKTGLVYLGSTSAYGQEVGVIDPKKKALVATIPVSLTGPNMNSARANQTTQLVYFRQLNSSQITVVDGRSKSPTFNQALPPFVVTDWVQSFAFDESFGLMYVTSINYGDDVNPQQCRLSVVDVKPGNTTFHKVLKEFLFPAGALARGVAVNKNTHKAYVAVAGGEAGVYVYDGTTLAPIPAVTVNSIGVIVNETENMIYATAGGNRLNAIDGYTGTVTVIPMPALIGGGAFDERLAVNRLTGRVYVRSNDVLTSGKVIVVDGSRGSATFNTVLASIEVGRASGTVGLVVDEDLNRILTTSVVDLRTDIIDGASNTVVAQILTKQLPSAMALNTATHRAYVANQPNFVQAIDVASNTLVATVVTGAELGWGALNTADHRLYFELTNATAGVRWVDKNGNLGNVTGLPTTAGRYVFETINGNTKRIYVQNAASNLFGSSFSIPGFVSVISGKKVVADVPTGNQPFGLAVDETANKVYSVNAGFGAAFPGSITVIDGATNTALQAETSAFPPEGQSFSAPVAVNEFTGKVYFAASGVPSTLGVLNGNVASPLPPPLDALQDQVYDIAVGKIVNRVYVATRNTGVVHVLDSADTEIASLATGSPVVLAINQTTGTVYAANVDHNSVSVIDGGTSTIVATIPVGSQPAFLAVNELANRVYVYNANGSSVSFINGVTNTVDATVVVPGPPITNLGVALRTDPAVARVFALQSDGNGLLTILSDTGGTLTALNQAIVAATAGDPANVRNNMLDKVTGAQTALAKGNASGVINKMQALSTQVGAQRGKALTNAEADHIQALIDAVIASVS